MIHSRVRWTAVAIFAAVMTVAEFFAIQATARDARRWLASDEARGLQQAGHAVAAAVTGAADRDCGTCTVMVRGISKGELKSALHEARQRMHEARRLHEARVIAFDEEI